jgi:hypothetical protein
VIGVRGLSEEKHPIEEPCKSRTCTRLAIGRWAFCIVFGTSRRVFARKRASGVTELSMKHLYRVFFLHRSDYPDHWTRPHWGGITESLFQ